MAANTALARVLVSLTTTAGMLRFFAVRARKGQYAQFPTLPVNVTVRPMNTQVHSVPSEEVESNISHAVGTTTVTLPGAEKARAYNFLKDVRTACWNNAKDVPGRDSGRWKQDKLGNVVFILFHGCFGPMCYNFDHALPYSKEGTNEEHNCQVLQTSVNLAKKDSLLDVTAFTGSAFFSNPTHYAMNSIEVNGFGNLIAGGKVVCKVYKNQEVAKKRKPQIPQCPTEAKLLEAMRRRVLAGVSDRTIN